MGPNIGQNVSIKAHRITNRICFLMEAQSLQLYYKQTHTHRDIYLYILLIHKIIF